MKTGTVVKFEHTPEESERFFWTVAMKLYGGRDGIRGGVSISEIYKKIDELMSINI